MLKPSTRTMLARHMQDIRDVFAEGLAARFGRTPEEIRDEGLRAGDFQINESIELVLADGSTISLQYAFVIFDPQQGIVGVFSEHCGYFCFGMADLRVNELRDGAVVARHPMVN